jgi:hypothetical protein
MKAYNRVVSNKGVAGVDCMTTANSKDTCPSKKSTVGFDENCGASCGGSGRNSEPEPIN